MSRPRQVRRSRWLFVAAAWTTTFVGIGHPRSDAGVSFKDLSRVAPSEPEAIRAVALQGSALALWEVLERGELVECLDCIVQIEPLLFHADARVREIAAWWLRHRLLGYLEIASQMRLVLVQDPDAIRRAAAAEALGEFLDAGATPVLRNSIEGDPDARVRRAALLAIRRLQDASASPSVAKALSDMDASVRLAAVETAMRMADFADLAALSQRLTDEDANVRAKAAAALGTQRAVNQAGALLALANSDPQLEVRMAAVTALGNIHEVSMLGELESIRQRDTSSRVRDAAAIAALKLTTR